MGRALTVRASASGSGSVAQYADRSILIAEMVGDPEALSTAFRQSGLRYHSLGAPITAATYYRGSADIARRFGLDNALTGALSNQVAVAFGHDLDAALTIGREAVEDNAVVACGQASTWPLATTCCRSGPRGGWLRQRRFMGQPGRVWSIPDLGSC